MSDQSGAEIKKSAGAQDSNSSHQANQGWEDLNNGFHPTFGSDNKIVIDICFHQKTICYDCENDKGHDKV